VNSNKNNSISEQSFKFLLEKLRQKKWNNLPMKILGSHKVCFRLAHLSIFKVYLNTRFRIFFKLSKNVDSRW